MKKEEGRKKHNNKIYQSKKQKSNHSDIRFNIDIDRPDHEAEQTIYLSHNVQYTIKYSAASGHSLSYADYIFFVPQPWPYCRRAGATAGATIPRPWPYCRRAGATAVAGQRGPAEQYGQNRTDDRCCEWPGRNRSSLTRGRGGYHTA